ncbi:ParB/RepB/Spo0J family partition protein [Deinococcus sp. HMF7620]|uniref:ParB/RepB/Spo0J family partition protein n=1 Tax=Deinococcus arboris TaxID=2682977 RepID=A0A7C9LMI9_9DEIO|nr:ParB/RepB/Spo0J family partition protein [Deinococcus arboris]MVN86396.1 ParB/RepB/Spo0J family partition protein [Deinococcus arboris]
MKKARPVIGSRLSGLVPGIDTLAQPATTTLPTDQLTPGAFQPRLHFSTESLAELSASIREQGVLQPLLVRPLPSGAYEIVAGERRWRAAQQAGLDELPVLIRRLSDLEARLAAAVENLQREDLNVMEEVRAKVQVAAATLNVPEDAAVARLFALERDPDPALVAALDTAFGALGRESWRSFIRNRAALLNLPEDVQIAVRAGLDYRKALIIGRAPAVDRAHLIEGALAGATVAQLREQVAGRQDAEPDLGQLVARQLRDRRVLSRLDDRRRAKVQKLLRQLQDLLTQDEA